MEKIFELVTKSVIDVSEEITKTITETFNKNNKSLENLNNKLLEIMNDRGILATCLMSPLCKITNLGISSQYKLVKDSNSNRVNDLKKNKTIPITLHNNLFLFRDTGKKFELKGDLSERITNKNNNVDLASFADKKLMYNFAKEMHFDLKARGNKSTRYRTLIKLPESPGLRFSASGTSKTIFLPFYGDELCHRIKLILQEKHAGINSHINNDEIAAIVDKLLE